MVDGNRSRQDCVGWFTVHCSDPTTPRGTSESEVIGISSGAATTLIASFSAAVETSSNWRRDMTRCRLGARRSSGARNGVASARRLSTPPEAYRGMSCGALAYAVLSPSAKSGVSAANADTTRRLLRFMSNPPTDLGDALERRQCARRGYRQVATGLTIVHRTRKDCGAPK
jgi:hypothetical protein